MVVFDNIDKTMYVVVTARVDGEADARTGVSRGPAAGRQDRDGTGGYSVTLQGTDICSSGEASIAYRSNFRREDLKKRCGSACATSRRAIFSRS